MDECIVHCLKLLLENDNITRVLEKYLEYICLNTSSDFGLIGEKIKTDDNKTLHRYYGIYGMDDQCQHMETYKIKGYLDDDNHKTFDAIDKTVAYNDVLRQKGTLFPDWHPCCDKLIVSPLTNSKGKDFGIIVIASKENQYTEEKIKKIDDLRDMNSLLFELSLDRLYLLRSKNSFLANLSHEIRTPLSGITCMTKVILKKEIPEQIKQYFKIINTCCTQLTNLTNDILDYTAVSTGQIKLENSSFSLKILIEELIKIVHPRLSKNVTIEYSISPEVPKTILGDRMRIFQILMNIVDNSIKFTDTGKISISCSLNGNNTDRMDLKFCISDTGSGISKNRLVHIFDTVNHFNPHYLSSQCGVGLGLNIVKNLVKLHKGKIKIESEYGKWTKVTFNIILNKKNSYNLQNIVKSNQVLLLSKNDDIIDKVTEIFIESKIDIVNAFTLKSAMRYIVSDDHDVKVILMDNSFDPHQLNFITCIEINEAINLETLFNELKEVLGKEEKSPVKRERVVEPLNYKVLVAEDDTNNREVIKMMLENSGYSLENMKFVLDGAELYTELITNATSYDIVLVDLKMPVMNGIDAIKKFEKFCKNNPDSDISKYRKKMLIGALTASVSNDTERECYAVGMTCYLRKPVKPESIAELSVILKTIRS